jgi:hypothetical protein
MSGSCRAGDAGPASLTMACGRNHRAKLRQHDQPERECAEVISHRRFSLGQLRRAAGRQAFGMCTRCRRGASIDRWRSDFFW